MMIISLFAAVAFLANTASAQNLTSLPPSTTLPIVFTKAVDAGRSHVGDLVEAKTAQVVRLPNGSAVPAGAKVIGHVVLGNGFRYDKTPYAKQEASELGVRFETLMNRGEAIPLKVYIRALADTFSVVAAEEPGPSDMDPDKTTTQIGGDSVTPRESEVRSRNDDVVGYLKKGGVYAHLIASGVCDGSDTEQSMGIFSASACGLYGYAGTSLVDNGKNSGTLVLSSRRGTTKIYAHSAALLEVTQ